MDFDAVAPVLRSVAVSAASREPLDPLGIASDLGRDVESVDESLDSLEAAGLILLGGDGQGHVPLLLPAGRQYLAANGDVSGEVLWFLPSVIDDLHTRAALLAAGTSLVDEFRAALLRGAALAHARELVPPAFAAAVDEKLAIDLFAASVALTSRLSCGEAAGCLGEEIVAVALLDLADSHLEVEMERGTLTAEELGQARGELRSLFELFEDDDVLDLFDMVEPADAAVAQDSPIHEQMGKVDQRIEAWFRPFGGVPGTGYYAGRLRC